MYFINCETGPRKMRQLASQWQDQDLNPHEEISVHFSQKPNPHLVIIPTQLYSEWGHFSGVLISYIASQFMAMSCIPWGKHENWVKGLGINYYLHKILQAPRFIRPLQVYFHGEGWIPNTVFCTTTTTTTIVPLKAYSLPFGTP